MSLLDTASLIVTPNGYKEGKLYSVIPSDGSGDMSVVRATTATRVNSAGLVELVPYNLLTWSEDFTNAAWVATNATVTSNVIVSPSGVQNADLLQSIDTNAPRIRQTTTQTGNNVFTFSCFAKKGNVNFLILRNIAVNVGGGSRAWFNLDTGVVGTVNAGLTASIESVGSGWYRCSISGTTDSSPLNLIDIALSATDNTFTGAANENIYLWGAQLVEGSTAKDYQKTETRLNIPRLDYSNGTCPSLLVEPQRTNLLTYSSSFDNAAWTKVPLGGTALTTVVTANDTISPSGIQDADKIFMSLGGGTTTSDWARLQSQTFNQTSGTSYTISFWAWASQSSEVGKIVRVGIGGNTALLDFTLTATATRFIVTYTAAATGTDSLLFQLRGAQGLASTAEFYLWGAQLEAGAYPTSYIPTTSASVTRNADVISKTGISSLIGQTEGVLFLDLFASAKNNDANTFGTWIFAGDAAENLQIYNLGTTLYWYARNTGGIIIDQTANETLVEGTRYKIAYAYKSGDYALYINGVQKRTSANANVPVAVSQFNLSAGTFGASPVIVKNEYNSVVLFPTRLTNAQLATLTTI